MIKIDKRGGEHQTLISASVTEFADALGYCEYKIPLSIKGTKPKMTRLITLGTSAHKEKHDEELESEELEPVSQEQIADKQEDIVFARENIHSKLLIPFKFETKEGHEKALVSLSGRVDKIMRVGKTLVVQDDKFTKKPQTYKKKTQPYPNQLLQVLTYLNSLYSSFNGKDPKDWFDIPHIKKRWDIKIHDINTQKIYKTFSDYQDAISLYYLHTCLKKFASIALEITKPEHHNSKPKCSACNIKDFCDFKLI